MATKPFLWLTDVHLDRLSDGATRQLGADLHATYPAAQLAVITGDVAEFDSIESRLQRFGEGFNKPVYFVVGNHDAYGGSIAGLMKLAAEMGDRTVGLARWLTSSAGIDLGDATVLLGCDGWYDVLNGTGTSSPVMLTDFFEIEELYDYDYIRILRREAKRTHREDPPMLKGWAEQIAAVVRPLVQQQADDAAGRIRAAIEGGAKRIIFGTHVPPLALSAWHEGKPSEPDFLPWFSSKTMGDMLLEVSGEHPDVEFIVLCGHTHSSGVYRATENLTVLTGRATYGSPEVQAQLDF